MKNILLSALVATVLATGPAFAQVGWEDKVTMLAQLTVAEEVCDPFLNRDKISADIATLRLSLGNAITEGFVSAFIAAKNDLASQLIKYPDFCEKVAGFAASIGYASPSK